MLFASIDLAARIERAECRLIADSAAATARRRPEADVFVQEIAGGVAVFTVDDSPLNKVVGLGFDDPLDAAELERIERLFARRGASVRVELPCLADPSVGTLLTKRGYVLQGFENVLGLQLPASTLPERADGVETSISSPDEIGTWLDIVVTGFASPDDQGIPSDESYPREVLEGIIGDVVAADGFVRYLARRNNELAGGASMRMWDGIAQLCGAATLPQHRRHGVQTTLLAERLLHAGASDCDVAVVTTQPGSKSQENVQRLGFELLYTRAVLVLGR